MSIIILHNKEHKIELLIIQNVSTLHFNFFACKNLLLGTKVFAVLEQTLTNGGEIKFLNSQGCYPVGDLYNHTCTHRGLGSALLRSCMKMWMKGLP